MYALELEALVYGLLKRHTDLAVYNHVPDDAVTPFIRIGDIALRPWLISPKSMIASLTVAIFSEKNSNKEAIELASAVREVLMSSLIGPSIIQAHLRDTRIFQLKNLTWCAEIEIEVRCYLNEELKCTKQK